MNRHDLATLGTMIYGGRWQTALSRDLGVSSRTVRHWVAGKYQVPEGVFEEIIEMAAEVQVARIIELIHDVGIAPYEIPIQVYEQDEDVRGQNLTAEIHRAMCKRTAEILHDAGHNAFIKLWTPKNLPVQCD